MDTKLRAGNGYLDDAEFSMRRLVARPQRGLAYSELLKPAAWSHHTTQNVINPGTMIEVLPEDGSYYALLFVQSKNDSGIVVAEVLKKDLGPAANISVPAEEVFVEWGGAHKWRVVRASDSDVLVKDFVNEQDALGWVSNNRKKIVAKPTKVAA